MRADFTNALDEFYLARARTLSVRPELSSTPHSSASSEAAAKAAERNREQMKRKLNAEKDATKARAQKASSHRFPEPVNGGSRPRWGLKPSDTIAHGVVAPTA